MKQLSEIEFLGFVIKTDRKGECDLWGDIETIGDVWKSDLGHFSSVRLAKKAAVFCFMIQNPKIFHAVIGRRLLYKTPVYGEWFKLVASIQSKGLKIPKELTKSSNGMSHILFCTKGL